jgi:putative membrane protein
MPVSAPVNGKRDGTRDLLVFAALLAPVFAWSAWVPKDTLTWWLEVAPVLIGFAASWVVRRRFACSRLLLVALWLHAVILLVGGHYTYAEMPLGDWVRDWTGGARNNYDKLGHFVQGFVPALLVREILLRTSSLGGCALKGAEGEAAPLRPSRWLGFLCGSVALAFSALYELIEWLAAVLGGGSAEAFLGTQGYVWDTQTDMAMALAGAILALSFAGGAHDRSVARLLKRESLASAPTAKLSAQA